MHSEQQHGNPIAPRFALLRVSFQRAARYTSSIKTQTQLSRHAFCDSTDALHCAEKQMLQMRLLPFLLSVDLVFPTDVDASINRPCMVCMVHRSRSPGSAQLGMARLLSSFALAFFYSLPPSLSPYLRVRHVTATSDLTQRIAQLTCATGRWPIKYSVAFEKKKKNNNKK